MNNARPKVHRWIGELHAPGFRNRGSCGEPCVDLKACVRGSTQSQSLPGARCRLWLNVTFEQVLTSLPSSFPAAEIDKYLAAETLMPL